MSDLRRPRTTGLYKAFYWIGIIMTLACFAFVLAGSTELLWPLEHAGFPLSWAFGAFAIVSFVAAEVCPLPSATSPYGEAEEAEQVPSGELETVGF
jgi:hypothetical protein